MKSRIVELSKSAIAIVLLGTFAAGCTAEASVGPIGVPPGNGTLTQNWSIGSRSPRIDPSLCATYGADRMELVIKDTRGRVVASAEQNCEEGEMTVTLPEGSYVADAVLIAADNTDVSTTLQLEPFRIYDGRDTFVDTDFPIDSMLTVLAAPTEPTGAEIDESAD